MNRYKNIIEQRLDEKHKRRKHNSSITPKIDLAAFSSKDFTSPPKTGDW